VQDATAAFAALVQREDPDIPLDRAALLIAAHAYPDLDVDAELELLDDLAAGCMGATSGPPDAMDVMSHLFERCGFSGNREEYGDPRNSFLNQVLRRRLGIPITLAVLAMEVGRRVGVAIEGVGMPGHFLVRAGDMVLDPFEGGRRLDADACRLLLAESAGPAVPFDESLLEPVGRRTILARVLANLRQLYVLSGSSEELAWVMRLRTSIPGVPRSELVDLARAVAQRGRFTDAAAALEQLAGEDVPGVDNGRLQAHARMLRARLN
jgi:regulator of sirC expression with transglutaminase-like and TPR domain